MTQQQGTIWVSPSGQRFWIVQGALPVLLAPGQAPPVFQPSIGASAEYFQGTEQVQAEIQARELGVTELTSGPSFERVTMPEAGADLRDMWMTHPSGDLGGGDAALAAAAAGPLVAGGMVLGLRALLARLPASVRGVAEQVIKGMGAVGTRVGWNRLPSWLQQILIFTGITAGIDILIDTGPNDRGVIQLPGTSDLNLGQIAGVTIVGSWVANGVQFVKLSDGRLGAQNKRGVWKFWRPKKPIVLFASGASSLNTYLRADAALNRQSKRLRTALNRRAPRGKKAPKAVQGQVIAVDGTRIVRNG